MNKFNPPSVTGPEMLDAVLERTGYASPGGCGLRTRPKCSIQRWTSPHWRRFAIGPATDFRARRNSTERVPAARLRVGKARENNRRRAIGRTGETPHGGGGMLSTGRGWMG